MYLTLEEMAHIQFRMTSTRARARLDAIPYHLFVQPVVEQVLECMEVHAPYPGRIGGQ